MLETVKHKLSKPQDADDVVQTINSLADNFERIDDLIDESTSDLNTFLKSGTLYKRGKKVWNLSPTLDGGIGWVNLREGRFAQTWQSETVYSVGDLITTNLKNGHVYECIEDGTSAVEEPLFSMETDSQIYDQQDAKQWIPNEIYELDDIVIATNGSVLYYYKCIASGTSGETEPSWATTTGMTMNDGTVQWRTYKTAKWKEAGVSCDFKEFGKIY